MGLFSSINTVSTGLTAQRLRIDVISNNIANVETTRTSEGGAYRRQRIIFLQELESILKDLLYLNILIMGLDRA